LLAAPRDPGGLHSFDVIADPASHVIVKAANRLAKSSALSSDVSIDSTRTLTRPGGAASFCANSKVPSGRITPKVSSYGRHVGIILRLAARASNNEPVTPPAPPAPRPGT
jgi:hypothetical protein